MLLPLVTSARQGVTGPRWDTMWYSRDQFVRTPWIPKATWLYHPRRLSISHALPNIEPGTMKSVLLEWRLDHMWAEFGNDSACAGSSQDFLGKKSWPP